VPRRLGTIVKPNAAQALQAREPPELTYIDIDPFLESF